MKKIFKAIDRGLLFLHAKKLLFILLTVLLTSSGTFLIYLNAKKSPNVPAVLEKTEELKKSSVEPAEKAAPSTANFQTPASTAPKKSTSTKTAPKSSGSSSTPPPTAPPTVVAFYGDSQSDTDLEDQNHQRVVNYILGTSASTVFHAGDLLEDGTVASLNRFNSVTSQLRSQKSFYSAQGNNERNSSVYFNNFNYPGNEHWFSVNVGNLHMIVLDNYASSVSLGSAQYNWLLSDLQSSASQSKITGVIFHYPVYGAGGDSRGMLNAMVPLFRTYGVDFVVSGHEHSYQKKQVDGIYYFVTSGQTSLGYMTANIYTDRVLFNVYNSNNLKVDTVSFNER